LQGDPLASRAVGGSTTGAHGQDQIRRTCRRHAEEISRNNDEDCITTFTMRIAEGVPVAMPRKALQFFPESVI